MADNKFFSSPSVDVIEKSQKLLEIFFQKQILELMVKLKATLTLQEKLWLVIQEIFQEN